MAKRSPQTQSQINAVRTIDRYFDGDRTEKSLRLAVGKASIQTLTNVLVRKKSIIGLLRAQITSLREDNGTLRDQLAEAHDQVRELNGQLAVATAADAAERLEKRRLNNEVEFLRSIIKKLLTLN